MTLFSMPARRQGFTSSIIQLAARYESRAGAINDAFHAAEFRHATTFGHAAFVAHFPLMLGHHRPEEARQYCRVGRRAR